MIINKATQLFVQMHRRDDVRQTALKYSNTCNEVDMPMALQQIAGWQAACSKLPSWAAQPEIIYPIHLSMEQCSSQVTAGYKVRVVKQWLEQHNDNRLPCHSGQHSSENGSKGNEETTMTDLTGGFGVDFTLLAPLFAHATYVEQNSTLAAIVEHNLRVMLPQDIQTVCTNGVDYLHNMPPATMIFADPARRDQQGGRTFAIDNCTPNVKELKTLLMQKAQMVMLKLSPMLDWRKAVADMAPWVSQVHIVSVNSECKELLLVMEHRSNQPTAGAGQEGIKVVCHGEHVDAQGRCTGTMEEVFELSVSHPQQEATSLTASAQGSLSVPEHPSMAQLQQGDLYLYEPDAAWMKAGLFELMEQRYTMSQLSPNSHLFVSSTYQPTFPGRHFAITRACTMGKELRQALQGMTQANITVRNFPLSVADLRKRLKLKEGGSTFLFATTLCNQLKAVLLCKRLGNGYQSHLPPTEPPTEC